MQGFEFEGMCIEDPTMSPCGRFEVDPVEYYGFDYLVTTSVGDKSDDNASCPRND